MVDLVIVGAGGFGREVYQWARAAFELPEHRVKGFLSPRPDELKGWRIEVPVLGDGESYRIEQWDRPGQKRLVAFVVLSEEEVGSGLDTAWLSTGTKFGTTSTLYLKSKRLRQASLAINSSKFLGLRMFWHYFPHAGLMLPETEQLANRVLALPTGAGVSIGGCSYGLRNHQISHREWPSGEWHA